MYGNINSFPIFSHFQIICPNHVVKSKKNVMFSKKPVEYANIFYLSKKFLSRKYCNLFYPNSLSYFFYQKND